MSVLLETTVGDLVIDLFTDQRPRACLNFLKLCKVKYYNVCLFHFVQRNFTAQTGDPTGTGKGGESIFRSLYGEQAKLFEAETKPRLKHRNKGTVSMVNNGENMHGSQFFVTLADGLDYLDGIHTVFGEVTEGFDVLDKINETICDDSNTPYQDIRISHTVILDDPFDDPSGLKIPDRSPEPTKEQLESGRIGADEKIDDTEGKTVEEVDEMIAVREQKAGAQILEMIGDIPDAEIKPPENVLFVCKLNPVTTDEDLEIIFSRFGQITSCEIVRDQKNGESLQYAFIEFEKEEDCERAYFKMDNVLIDDRRIHVDFSQSVAHIQWTKQGAKPVMSEKKDEKPKYTVKNTSRKDKYDLVFDNDSGDERKREKRKDKHTNKIGDRDSSKGRYKRTSPSDDDDRRNRDRSRDDRKERRHDDSDNENRKNRDRRRDDSDDDDRKERRRDNKSDDDDDRRKTKERRNENSDDDRQRREERTRNDDRSRRKKARRDDSSDDDDTERKGKYKHKYHHEDRDSLHHRKEDGRRKERSKDEDYYKHKNSDKYSSRDKDRHRHHRQDRE